MSVAVCPSPVVDSAGLPASHSLGSARDRRPKALFVALSNNVGIERVISDMAGCGVDCGLLSPAGYWSAYTGGLSRHFLLPPHLGISLSALLVRQRLEWVQKSWVPDIVIPLDDMSSALLTELSVSPHISSELRSALAGMSLPTGRSKKQIRSRSEFIALAAELGLRVPMNVPVASVDEAIGAASGDLGYPAVLKLDHTCGGVGVTIARDEKQLADAFLKLGRATWYQPLKRRAKELVWRLAGAPHLGSSSFSVQEFIVGRPAMRTVAAWKGRVLEGVSFVAEQIHPPSTGASTVVSYIRNAEMDQACCELIAALGCSGFFSFDFIIDARGAAYLTEMNARPIGSTHLGQRFGHDICAALAAKLGADVSGRAACKPLASAVALFPKELLRNPAFAAQDSADAVFHDVPWDDLPLLKNYRRYLTKHGLSEQAKHLNARGDGASFKIHRGRLPRDCGAGRLR